jgi:hypothetical protein
MRVYVETQLPCEGDSAWDAVQTAALFSEVAYPMATIRPPVGETLPERWQPESSIRCRCYLFGLIPIGTRTVQFEKIDHESREMQTRESDPLVRRWDHVIRVRPDGPGRCRYSDEIEIKAGMLTLFIWLYAMVFYRHRQRRWRRVARRLSGELSLGHPFLM